MRCEPFSNKCVKAKRCEPLGWNPDMQGFLNEKSRSTNLLFRFGDPDGKRAKRVRWTIKRRRFSVRMEAFERNSEKATVSNRGVKAKRCEPLGSNPDMQGFLNEKNRHLYLLFRFGDPDGIRTHDTAVKGRCLNHLTTGPRTLNW